MIDPLASLKRRSETEITRSILAYLATVPGVVAWRNNVGAVTTSNAAGKQRNVRFGFRGLPDILGWLRWCPVTNSLAHAPRGHDVARFLAIEVKRPGGTPTVAQRGFLDAVQRDGGLALVATSVEDVVRALRRGGRE